MLSRTRILIGVLGAAVIGLAVALGIVAAAGNEDDDHDQRMLTGQSGYPG